ncbi:hypothetical protein ML401_37050 (plasmid) [Bradyrhizobium sp. 62B]|uniref:alpha/beta hydrolase family protein n=1 Tax=Bradyrhizobium sp. 62B TaxID=2898442 RepID=UPI0025581B6D|nr:hypothetical protein ML401_37050 [Bradyrhizobium sp. 62B]
MDGAAWPQVREDLASTRKSAAAFLDNLEGASRSMGPREWATRWISISAAHESLGDTNRTLGYRNEAASAWLCALTTWEVAKRLLNLDSSDDEEVAARIDATVWKFHSLEQKIQHVKIECYDHYEIAALYLSGRSANTPAVICISGDGETATMLLGRLLPVVVDRGISVLVVTHDEVSRRQRGESDMLLSACLDYLSARSDVDARRIGVYGDGISAALATDFAASDRRVAAAVCDGGLWNWARMTASINWLATAAKEPNEKMMSAYRSRCLRQLKCPALVVAGGRGIVSLSEAIELERDVEGTGPVDLQLPIPRLARAPVAQVENFVTSDDRIFSWLIDKLQSHPAL